MITCRTAIKYIFDTALIIRPDIKEDIILRHFPENDSYQLLKGKAICRFKIYTLFYIYIYTPMTSIIQSKVQRI